MIDSQQIRPVGNVLDLHDVGFLHPASLADQLAFVDAGVVTEGCNLLCCPQHLPQLQELLGHVFAVEGLLGLDLEHDEPGLLADPATGHDELCLDSSLMTVTQIKDALVVLHELIACLSQLEEIVFQFRKLLLLRL